MLLLYFEFKGDISWKCVYNSELHPVRIAPLIKIHHSRDKKERHRPLRTAVTFQDPRAPPSHSHKEGCLTLSSNLSHSALAHRLTIRCVPYFNYLGSSPELDLKASQTYPVRRMHSQRPLLVLKSHTELTNLCTTGVTARAAIAIRLLTITNGL